MTNSRWIKYIIGKTFNMNSIKFIKQGEVKNG